MVVDYLKKFVSIPSVSDEEAELASVVYDLMSEHGLKPKRQGNNVWGQIGDGSGPRLLLNSHIDTVPPTSAWTRDPYAVSEEDGKIYGLGSNDAKASCASMLTAAIAMKDFVISQSGTLLVALTCNEEVGRKGLETITDLLKPLDGAIIGEPNGMNICVAQKGSLVLELFWRGIAGHAAHGTSDHALLKSIEDLHRISKLEWSREDPFLGKTTLEITQVHSGSRTNVIPEESKAVLDIRYAPIYSEEEILGTLKENCRAEFRIHSNRRVAVETSPEARIVRAARRAQPEKELVGSKTSSDWVFLKGIPTIKMGSGDTRRSHTADEFVKREEVESAVEIYKKTIEKFFSDA